MIAALNDLQEERPPYDPLSIRLCVPLLGNSTTEFAVIVPRRLFAPPPTQRIIKCVMRVRLFMCE